MEPPPNFYQLRVVNGDYEHIASNLLNFQKRALVSVEYGLDFERDPKRGFRTKTPDDKYTPFSTWVFGEIASRDLGTLHQASGNHFIGCPPVRPSPFPPRILTHAPLSTTSLTTALKSKTSLCLNHRLMRPGN